MQNIKEKLIPLSLTAVIVIIDQISKYLISNSIKLNTSVEVIGDFFRLWHVRNPNIAFGIGRGLPPIVKLILFTIGGVILLGVVFYLYFTSKEIKKSYRWPFAAISCCWGLQRACSSGRWFST